ncbi:MAG: hypothetical protein ACW99A_24225, partial [Candidatus Kariarchaeaceae archaeon]
FLFGLMGDVFWLGAVFFPEEITKFILSFSSSAEYTDLSDEGLTVIRVLIGIMASLIWLVAILLVYLSLNYEDKSRNWIGGAALAWFLGDSIISYIADFKMNIIFNLLSFVPIAVILYLSKEESSH